MTSAILVSAPPHLISLYLNCSLHHHSSSTPPYLASSTILIRKRAIIIKTVGLGVVTSNFVVSDICWSKPSSGFSDIPNSGGVKALDLRVGDGQLPVSGDQVYIHYYGRLAAKQGWRFDSTYDHKDETGEPIPFTFILGSGKVISGIEAAVRSMKVGSICRVVIPPSQGYQNTSQEPIPPNVLWFMKTRRIVSNRRQDFLIGKGCSLRSSIRHASPMEKAPHLELSYLILSWSI